MICPKCKFEQADRNLECIRCGIIFAKIRPSAESTITSEADPLPPIATNEARHFDRFAWAKDLLLFVEPQVNPLFLAGRVIVYLILLIWGWKFIVTPMETNYVGESFMHNINLPFHEAGHIIFSPLGRFLTILGGTLGQLLMPFICLCAFLIKNRDPFGASVGLWWVGQNFMDIAPYINDARALELVLLGGVTGKDVEDYHDWENILGTLGWLQYDHAIAQASYRLGILLMVAAFIWGGYMLSLQFKHRDSFS